MIVGPLVSRNPIDAQIEPVWQGSGLLAQMPGPNPSEPRSIPLTVRFSPDFPAYRLELRLFLEAQTAEQRHTTFEAAFLYL